MHIGVAHQFQNLGCFFVVLEFHLKLIVDIPETIDPLILDRGNLSAGLDDLRLSPA